MIAGLPKVIKKTPLGDNFQRRFFLWAMRFLIMGSQTKREKSDEDI